MKALLVKSLIFLAPAPYLIFLWSFTKSSEEKLVFIVTLIVYSPLWYAYLRLYGRNTNKFVESVFGLLIILPSMIYYGLRILKDIDIRTLEISGAVALFGVCWYVVKRLREW
jgi:hypothetical protein